MQSTNPLRAAWNYLTGYMRGDDIKAANARAIALASAARASGSAAPPAAPVTPASPAIDRRRM